LILLAIQTGRRPVPGHGPWPEGTILAAKLSPGASWLHTSHKALRSPLVRFSQEQGGDTWGRRPLRQPPAFLRGQPSRPIGPSPRALAYPTGINTEANSREVSAPTLGLQIQAVNASTIGEINAAFAALARERADALFVIGNAFFISQRVQLVTLATRDRILADVIFPQSAGS
jgi:hypothetical protein